MDRWRFWREMQTAGCSFTKQAAITNMNSSGKALSQRAVHNFSPQANSMAMAGLNSLSARKCGQKILTRGVTTGSSQSSHKQATIPTARCGINEFGTHAMAETG